MERFNSRQLISSLTEDVQQFTRHLLQLQCETASVLERQPAPDKWSIAQVLDHLNRYGQYYLPRLESALQKAAPGREDYKPGWLGDYFTRLMQPGADGVIAKKMKAPKGYRPPYKQDGKHNVALALEQQAHLMTLLEQATTKDMASVRIPISLSPVLRLKAGDTFRFLVAHQNRHLVQIRQALAISGRN